MISSFNEKSISSFAILSDIEKRIKEKIESVGVPLRNWDIQINYGIKTGFNEAFIIDGKTKDELITKSSKNAEIIRPILRGRDIKRYGYEFADLWLIYIPWHFPLHKDSIISGASEKAEQEFLKEYPDIYNHLLKYKKELSGRNRAETGIRYEWYALQRWGANYMDDFSKQKIVWKRVGSILRFGIDMKGCVTLDSTCFATGNNLKY
ncbi:TaqI-like C-terminal specificity domain-containing protein, partial [Dysgonomonas reticulitermitis]